MNKFCIDGGSNECVEIVYLVWGSLVHSLKGYDAHVEFSCYNEYVNSIIKVHCDVIENIWILNTKDEKTSWVGRVYENVYCCTWIAGISKNRKAFLFVFHTKKAS